VRGARLDSCSLGLRGDSGKGGRVDCVLLCESCSPGHCGRPHEHGPSAASATRARPASRTQASRGGGDRATRPRGGDHHTAFWLEGCLAADGCCSWESREGSDDKLSWSQDDMWYSCHYTILTSYWKGIHRSFCVWVLYG
jgi:hypothetical protein